ncbi:MAG: GTPase, partial [candidate division WOR-3 bacterium]
LDLAGYTNAGKSALFNALTGSDVAVSSQVFATLDASTRVLRLDRHHRILLTDTIGFIRNLPPQLVASFRATLGEIREADLILHVVDASVDDVGERIDVVNETLNAIGAGNAQRLLVFNKIDLVFDTARLERFNRDYSGSIFVSALTGTGLDALRKRVADFAGERLITAELFVPKHRPDIESLIRSSARVIAVSESDGLFRFQLIGEPAVLGRLRKQVVAAVRE